MKCEHDVYTPKYYCIFVEIMTGGFIARMSVFLVFHDTYGLIK